MASSDVTVLQLITRLNVGGPARSTLLLARELGRPFRTVVAAGRPAVDEGEVSDAEVPVRPVPLTRPLRPLTDVRALGVVRNVLRETRAQLVHTHMAKAGAVGRLASLTVHPRPRTVHTYHGHVLGGYFSAAAERAFLRIEQLLAPRTDALVTVSTEIRGELLARGIGRASQYVVIPVGLDLSPYLAVNGQRGELRRHLGLAANVPLIGAIGRLVPIKDIDTLLQAMVELPEVHLAVVGDGEERHRLETVTTGLGLSRRVHFTGWWEGVASVLSDLDVVVLTSRNEGTPVALVEAQAAARPVVATDVGGVRAVVEDGVTGFLAPSGDSSAVASLVQRCLDTPRLSAALGQAGRSRSRQQFGKERFLSETRALYGELVARSSTSR
jgi:glycosyltransferase involved in cell wall biosynthesis